MGLSRNLGLDYLTCLAFAASVVASTHPYLENLSFRPPRRRTNYWSPSHSGFSVESSIHWSTHCFGEKWIVGSCQARPTSGSDLPAPHDPLPKLSTG